VVLVLPCVPVVEPPIAPVVAVVAELVPVVVAPLEALLPPVPVTLAVEPLVFPGGAVDPQPDARAMRTAATRYDEARLSIETLAIGQCGGSHATQFRSDATTPGWGTV
jgi:hypothetical protein